MIPFKNLRQYTQVVNGLIFHRDPKNPTALIYFSENSTFIKDFPQLNLRKADFQIVVVPFTKIPRTFLSSEMRDVYKAYKLTAYTTRQRIPTGRNVIFDISNYIKAVDQRLKPNNYRQRAGFLIRDSLERALRFFPDNYNKILIYSVNSTKDLNNFINRKSFPIVQAMKNEDIFFEDMILTTITPKGAQYRLLVKDGDYQFRRVLQLLRNIKTVDQEDDIEKDAKKSSSEVISSVKDNITNTSAVKSAIADFLEDDKEAREKVSSGEATKSDLEKITATAILYRLSGDYFGAKRIAKSINDKNSSKVLKAINKNFSDELLKPEKTISLSTDPRISVFSTPDVIGNKSPEHIFQKRKIDFETNLKNDMVNAFKVLEKRDPPLKFQSIDIEDKPQRAGELLKSDISILKVKLKDKFGKIQEVQIEVPKINPNTGTFRVNGQTKIMINQIIRNPITFPAPGQARFESSYSTFRINVKELRKATFFDSFMIYKMPFMYLLGFAFGFERSMKNYGIKYRIVSERPPKTVEYWVRIRGSEYIIFENVDTNLKKYLVMSFIHGESDKHGVSGNFPSKEYFENLIIAHTGRINSTFQIGMSVQNIVDPVSKQVLLNKQQPTELEDIMKYMASRAADKLFIPRNDLTNQRIRNSEVLVHLAQKQILAAHTTYREQVLGGNEDAQLAILPTKVLKDFKMTELTMSMEYANPVEEMSSITRISPSGKEIGGIPDKRSIYGVARNLHDTYFGNIDPLDTPEGGTIGLVQQLTVDALITSARGMFKDKKITDDEGSGMLSTSAAMTPFIENNDGARVIMLTNQAKQMLPLKNPEPPIVQSGYESILTNVLSENFIKRAPCNGKIEKITEDAIIMKCTNGKREEIDITPMHLRSGSGKNTLSVFKAMVVEGRIVKKGDIVAEGACMSNGSISLGRPLLVAFMPYKGYNFEDGVIVNERLVGEDKLTSLHGIEEEVLLSENDRLLFIANIGDRLEKGKPILRKSIGEIEQLIGFEEDDDEDIYSGQFIKKSPGGVIVDIDVYSNVDEGTFPQLKKLIQRTNKKYGKPTKEKFTIAGESIKGVLIKFRIEQELPIQLGDKLCNRHGNKGIISLLEEDGLMPRTPFGTIDVILNPVGILGRMNMGQVYEMYCGLIAKQLGLTLPSMTKSKLTELLSKLYTHLDKSKNKETTKRMIANIKALSTNQYKLFVDNIKRSGFFPIIIPPFKSPNHNDIKKALQVVGLKTGYKLRIPEYNTTTQSKIPIGYMYLGKLEHLGEAKIYGRSTGPTTGKTAQPTAGKRRGGGQRVGEAETYAFISYNCTNTLAEMMGPLSDDYITRDEMISEIIEKGSAGYREAKFSPARDLLNSYFTSLMLKRG